MKPLTGRKLLPLLDDDALPSVRTVVALGADALWQADPAGNVTNVTPCRPLTPGIDGRLDDAEIRQLEEQWRKCTRVVERFSALYHVRSQGVATRTFLISAIPILDERDVVLYWSGIAAETDGLAEADTQFISDAAGVLSSSLNRSTILNRLAQAALHRFCDLCAIHALDQAGELHLEANADRRLLAEKPIDAYPEELRESIEAAIRTRRPLLLTPLELGPGDPMQSVLDAARARSLIVVPLLAGAGCTGALLFAESDRVSSFAPRDVEVAQIVGRQLTMALENIKTFEREQRLTERFRFLARVTEKLFATLDSRAMLALLLEELLGDFADYAVAATLADESLKIVASAGTNAGLRDTAEPEIITSLRDRHSILNGSLSNVGPGSRIKGGPLSEDDQPLSWVMVPLFVGDTVYGTIICCSNSHRYDPAELEVLEEIGRRASLALEHSESFARERRLIQTLQQATLPSRLATVEGATLSAVYRPAAIEVQVGGDWYDAFDLDGNRVLLTVGDVTGHGLEASIVMGKLRHAINVVAMYEPDPVRILDAAERILLRRYPGSVATAFVAIFDARDRSLTYANAGHPYPIVRANDGSLSELQADGLPIGLRSAGPPSTARTASLHDTALLAFYTDGLIEATRDIAAGERRLKEALATDAIFYVKSPAEFIENFALTEPSPDDVAILALNFIQAERWTFESQDWSKARSVRRDLLERLEARARNGSDVKAAELILGELLANVAQHASGRLDVALEWRVGNAVLHLVDRGTDFAAGSPRDADSLTEYGRGLWLIQRLGAQLRV